MALSRTLMLALAIVSAASAETFQVYWDYIPNAPLAVKVGDTLEFHWRSEFQDVHIHPTLDCTETGAIAVHFPPTEEGSIFYTFTAEDAINGGHDMFFASGVESHCTANTNLAVTVFPAEYR
jgi:hypothetical protein